MPPTLLVRAWLAGAVLSGVPSTAWTLWRGGSLVDSTRAAGTLLGRRSAVRGALAHAAISLWWTWVLGRWLRVRGPLAGAVAGAGVAGLDLAVVARRFPHIRALPMGPQVADHLAFGAVVGAVLGQAQPSPQFTP